VLNLTTLEMRATRGDMLQVYKIMMGLPELRKRIYLREMKEGEGGTT